MLQIKDVKKELRRREWSEMISECQSSGKKVADWCRENGISKNTYYCRLKIMRKEMLQNSEDMQSIVPVSVSSELTAEPSAMLSQPVPEEKIIMRKNGIEIELPQVINADMLMTLLRGLSQC